jgi:antitoxin (DNA-binding transcriptional repressor) of toxin-antitoxin stability system
MKEKSLIFFGLVILVIALIGLNAASYVQRETLPDSELAPNRSTYNAGATGTRAFFDLLAETGRSPSRWREPLSALNNSRNDKPATFVVIGATRREFTDDDVSNLLRWVTDGGNLVIIDREPPAALIATTANYKILTSSFAPAPFSAIDPSDQKQMTDKTEAAKPVQPTIFTKNVNAVQPSRFASSVAFERFTDFATAADDEEEEIESPALTAPVVHLANKEKNLLIDFPFGGGRIIFLTDPFIVSNGGISLVDNAQIGINITTSRGGIIAFDEYHQGFGAGENRLFSYFSGTPAAAIFLQFIALVAFVLYSQSRRFARPLPASEPDRLSKLEYVAAMAELQRRTKCFDLAVENIYTEFRRRASRLVGIDSRAASLEDLSRMIAERLDADESEIRGLLKKCEAVAHGETTDKKEVLSLVSRLRELEEKLGLKRAGKQI